MIISYNMCKYQDSCISTVWVFQYTNPDAGHRSKTKYCLIFVTPKKPSRLPSCPKPAKPRVLHYTQRVCDHQELFIQLLSLSPTAYDTPHCRGQIVAQVYPKIQDCPVIRGAFKWTLLSNM